MSRRDRPFVSIGRNRTEIPADRITTSNKKIANALWQLFTRLTATTGHNTPPILENELAAPNPVDLMDVG